MEKTPFRRIISGTIVLSLLGVLTACGPGGGPGEMPQAETASTPVETEIVSLGSIATRNQLSGKVVPRNAVSIYAPREGDVLSVSVAVGDTVEAGATLFSLDDASISREIAQLEGERSRTASLYDEQLTQAQQQLTNTQTLMDEQVRQAKQSFDNTKILYEKGAASDIELQQAEAKYTEVKLNADDTVYSARLSISRLQTEKANQLAVYDKNLADLRDSQSDMSVKATVAGTVTQVNVVRGGKASMQAAAVVIATDETPQISLSVSETIQPWLHVGDTVEVTISALGGEPLTASIASVAPAVNDQTHLYDVLLDLPEDTGAAYGMFAVVAIDTDPREDVIVIPTDAILSKSGQQYVFTVDGEGAAVRIDIETGLVGDGVTQVIEGLSVGDELVVAGQTYLSDGSPARVVKRDGVDVTAEDEAAPAEGEAPAEDASAAQDEEAPA